MDWQPIETAPKDGTFIALNRDEEVFVAKYDQHGRLCFRANRLYSPEKFTVHEIDGRRLLEKDEQFTTDNEEWRNDWVLWTRGYEFAPTHWMPLPTPPEDRP